MLLIENDLACVKMIDFGLSKDFSGQDTMSTMSGSPYYIAPEVFLQRYNHKIDVWSLGVVLYIMLSGKVPFPGNSELEIIGNVIKGDFHFNHEPFKHHSAEAKEFLVHLICKDVNQRFTAEQAMTHPWITQNVNKSSESMAGETFTDMQQTFELLKNKKAALTYLSQRMQPQNFTELQNQCLARDAPRSGMLSYEQFLQACEQSGMPMVQREFEVIMNDLDEKKLGTINYDEFLTSLFLSRMYLKELDLTLVLQETDTDGKGGVTIRQMQDLLQKHPDF